MTQNIQTTLRSEKEENFHQNGVLKKFSQPDQANNSKNHESFERMPFSVFLLALTGFYILIFLGFINQLLFSPKTAADKRRNGYGSIYHQFESLYLNYVYRRICDGWNRPICSVPGAEVVLKHRVSDDNNWTFRLSGTKTKCINLGSYNYLGFAQSHGACAEDSIKAIEKFGYSFGSCRRELGTASIHVELEQLMARFLRVEDCITFGMGYATNALNLPAIITEDSLVLSDERNHASLIVGLKLSKAVLKKYKHNDVEDLEKHLIEAMIDIPKMKNPYRKIFIICEGVFSMEGSIVHLPEIIALKKKYKAYLYVDEAHSIGAIGPTGRGAFDYYKCDPKDVDILMGTFTKSFGSAGGYIAGSKALIDHLRIHSDAVNYCSSMSPPVAQQIITSLKIIIGEDGTDEGTKRIRRLRENTHYFRNRLIQLGLIVYGHEDSPVVPVLTYFNSKVIKVVREYLKYNIATVGVGFPATPLLEGRLRFCLSASHTKEQLDRVIEICILYVSLLTANSDELIVKISTLFADAQQTFAAMYPKFFHYVLKVIQLT